MTLEKTISQFSGKNFSEFKESLIQVLVDRIEPISKEINKLMSNQDYLDKILDLGYEKANNIASEKVKKMKQLIGFY